MAHDASSCEQIYLSTQRLRLRTPTLEDAEALHELFADPVVMVPPPLPVVTGRVRRYT